MPVGGRGEMVGLVGVCPEGGTRHAGVRVGGGNRWKLLAVEMAVGGGENGWCWKWLLVVGKMVGGGNCWKWLLEIGGVGSGC